MREFSLVLVVTMAALLWGCKDPMIDGSSSQAYKQSISQASGKKRKCLEEAMALIASDIEETMKLTGEEGDIDEQVRQSIDGKKVSEVIKAGRQIAANLRRKELEKVTTVIHEAEMEIYQIEARFAHADQDQENLRKLLIEEARFFFSDDEFPTIDLKLQNNTPFPVGRIYFNATLSSPDVPEPWVDEKVIYKVSNWLQSGNAVVWRIVPDFPSSWHQVPRDRDDMELKVLIYRIDGDEVPIYDATYGDEDVLQLASLRQKIEQIRAQADVK